MSRLGVTFDEVLIAAEEIRQSGEKPTIDKVRTQLGSRGSNSTISKHLYNWRKKSESILGTGKSETPDFIKSVIESVWNKLNEQADAKIEKIKIESDTEIREILSIKFQLEENLNILSREHEKLNGYLNEISCQKELLILDLKSLNEDHSILKERYKCLEKLYLEVKEINSINLESISEIHKNEIERLTSFLNKKS